MHLVLREDPLPQRVVEVTARGACFEVIHQNARSTHERRSNLVLLGIVRTHRCDEASPQIHLICQDGRIRGCASDTNIRVRHGDTNAWHGPHWTSRRGPGSRECLRPCYVDVKNAHHFKTKHRPKGLELIFGLGSKDTDGCALGYISSAV